jgi:hypothetical protein
VVDQFLKRHGFVGQRAELKSPEVSPSRRRAMPNRDTGCARTPVGSPTDHARRAVSTVKAHRLPADTQSVHSISRSQTSSKRIAPETPLPIDMPPPQVVPRKRSIHRKDDNHHSSVISTPTPHEHYGEGLAGDHSDRTRLSIRSSAKRHKWIDGIVAVCPLSSD